ncbi:MAG: spermidine synthase [Limisphaerales bacterium]|jgi:spermidine synthase
MIRSIIVSLSLLCTLSVAADSVLLEKRSVYSNIIVKKSGSVVCLLFSVRKDQRNQSCINTRRPKAMVFAYTRMSMAALLFNDNPSNILVIGLGGGTLPTALSELYPQAEIDSIEIDPAVVSVAQEFFGYHLSDNQRIHTQDARIWVRRANLNKRRFDIIILDAFNGEYIPEHLMTEEFFTELNQMLTDDGVLISNTFSISALYDHESATYASVFGPFINFQLAESANRVVVAAKMEVSDEIIKARAKTLQDQLRPYSVPIKRYAKLLIRQRGDDPDWDTEARILTDQYAPANLLKTR